MPLYLKLMHLNLQIGAVQCLAAFLHTDSDCLRCVFEMETLDTLGFSFFIELNTCLSGSS